MEHGRAKIMSSHPFTRVYEKINEKDGINSLDSSDANIHPVNSLSELFHLVFSG